VSLGVGGQLSINLNSPLTTGPNEYLYIGEVGNNGEVAASNITVSSIPVGAPEPATWAMVLLGFAGLTYAAHRNRARNAAIA
jgi:hypothetical protein